MKFNHVLFIGPQNEKGGIGAVLETYRAEMEGFRMISTYPSDARTNKQIYFLKQLISILKLLITDEEIKILHIHCASKGSFIRKSMVAVLANTLGKKTIMHIHAGLLLHSVDKQITRSQERRIDRTKNVIKGDD